MVKMNKKGQTLIRHYIYGIIAFTLIIVGGMFLIGQFRSQSAGFVDDTLYGQFNRSFNTQDRLLSNTSKLKSDVQDAQPDQGTFGVLNSLINTAWSGIVFIFTGFGFMDTVFGGLAGVFGIPPFVAGIASLLVVALLVFVIWSAFFQKDV